MATLSAILCNLALLLLQSAQHFYSELAKLFISGMVSLFLNYHTQPDTKCIETHSSFFSSVCLLGLCFDIPVNIHGHVKAAS